MKLKDRAWLWYIAYLQRRINRKATARGIDDWIAAWMAGYKAGCKEVAKGRKR